MPISFHFFPPSNYNFFSWEQLFTIIRDNPFVNSAQFEMGITGEIVRNVFSRSRSLDSNTVKSNSVEKRRWSSVRSYLCGDEFDSVLAEEDSASVRSSRATFSMQAEEDSVSVPGSVSISVSVSGGSSEATVTQQIGKLGGKREEEEEEIKEQTQVEKQNSTSALFRRDDAAIVIQTAFRNFLARHADEDVKKKGELVVENGSPSKESVGTSVEVQTGNSTESFRFREGSFSVPHRMPHRQRAQILKLQEDWDDSTVSSTISKMRIQSRLEAATRRERALAYAFSQQLRICSKKKQNTDPNMGWSWLERWMATRQPESFFIETHMSKCSSVRRRLFEVAREEKESCGSNEVSIHIDSSSTTEKDEIDLSKNRPKVTKSKNKKTLQSYRYPNPTKVMKKHCRRDEQRQEAEAQTIRM